MTPAKLALAMSLAAGTAPGPAVAHRIGTGSVEPGLDRPGVQAHMPAGPSKGMPGEAEITPVADAGLIARPRGEWPTHRGGCHLPGFSPLDQIDRDTVGELRLAWSWALNGRRTQVHPLIRHGVMFFNQSVDAIQALDAATGDLIWTHRRELPEDLRPLAYANRNVALYGERVFVGASDAHLLALDAETGEVVWDVEVGDSDLGHQYTAGPIVAGSLVIVPMSGCHLYNPGGCWTSAHDPETETLYIPTAVPVPWGRARREALGIEGDLLHTNSTLATDVATGEIRWAHQHVLGDNFDLDTAFERHVPTTEVAPDPEAVRWIAEELPEDPTKILFGCSAGTASSTRWTPRPAGSSGRGRPTIRTSWPTSTSRRAGPRSKRSW